MRSFVLVMKEVPHITRHEIDRGLMKREALTLVSSIRSSVFTSRGVRRDVNVVLYPLETKRRVIRIEGEKLRFMGPDERSISILISMSFERLMSGRVGEVSSPGITVVDKSNHNMGIADDSLILNQSSDGGNLRNVEFKENTVYICTLDREWGFGDFGSIVQESTSHRIALSSTNETNVTILMINNEIDRQLGSKRLVA